MPPVALPDGPRSPRLALEFLLMARPLECLDNWARRYGDPFILGKGGPRPTVYCSDPSAIRAILTASPDMFEPRRGDKVLRFLLGEHAVQYLSGERHQRERRMLAPPFHGERMRAHLNLIREIAERAVRQWTPGQSFRVRPFTQEVTLRVISRVILGRDDERVLELRKRLTALMDFSSPRLHAMALTWLPRLEWGALSPWGRLTRHRSGIDELVFHEIRERREAGSPGHSDVLDMLMSARDEAGHPMSDQAVRDEVVSLLFAGHETTASALAWALYCIHQSPGVRERLVAELDAAGGAAAADILQLPYLMAVCQETLRLHPGIVAVPRTLTAPMEFMGFRFGPGTTLVPCMHLTHRREDLYPEPSRFRPERFLERQFSPYEYWPFGAGDRRCLGMAFAQFEMKLVLATVLSRWELSTAGQRDLKPVRRGVFAAPPSGMSLVAIRRRHDQ